MAGRSWRWRLLWGLAASLLVTGVGAVVQDAAVLVDTEGHLHINTTGTGTKVFVNGRDVELEMGQTRSLLEALYPTLYTPALYVLGGADLNDTVGDMLRLDAGTWTNLTSAVLLPRRASFGAVVFRNRIFTVGGRQFRPSPPYDVVASYNPVGWREEHPLPIARHSIGLTVFQDLLYVTGGANGSVLAMVDFFDGLSWQPGPSLLQARFGAAAVVYQDRLYVIGGYSNMGLNTVEVYNGTGSWAWAPALQVPRAFAGAQVFHGSVYVVGGVADGVYLSSMEVFDGATWSFGEPLPMPRGRMGLVVFQGLLVAIGGFNGQAAFPNVTTFDGLEWREQQPLPVPRSSTSCVVYPAA
ncbi:uncharacterized protein MONBRDRAFT_22325 [Monosiga brevicollis MX1]|uniref:Uncharacterized protein n=1 Tax=Monosiga brevicollis TaxID=81824 RepID=A9UQ89_MONBE|nr:uncharacterized protein MONBRDRAFT_22325 [Monosiga brevicollis MX1]EDQ93005.1 predicted protein [Monosiga brevicollis MX1]|eukprot:XP_001742767.1 hypothetical protein [Monosiga brevicollis MX1]